MPQTFGDRCATRRVEKATEGTKTNITAARRVQEGMKLCASFKDLELYFIVTL